jgi:SAM-dependent methyltransferase
MGINKDIVSYLLDCHKNGVDFSKVCTIGRQELHGEPEELCQSAARSHLPEAEQAVRKALGCSPPFAEPFFRALGAKEIVSFDNSNYEGASVLHDFNEPVPESYENRFTVVLDGGSLEHIFNFPVAISNCMRMLKEGGGHFIGLSYVNNAPGHGFYQFSPELMFRTFSETNGFGETEVCLLEHGGDGKRWRVTDPEAMKRRVQFVNTRPTFLFVRSRRMELRSLFAKWPIQSDYSALWSHTGGKYERTTINKHESAIPFASSLRRAVKALLPDQTVAWMRRKRLERKRQSKLTMPFKDDAYQPDVTQQ